MNSRRYAPIVHSRTAFVDFRPNFIGVPHDFSPTARQAARELVVAALDYAEKLDQGPRWVMFRVEQHLVAGVAARASWFSGELTHELKDGPDGKLIAGRLLCAFVGAAYPIEGAPPVLPTREQAFYRSLYGEVVESRFMERPTTTNWEDATETRYRDTEIADAGPGEKLDKDDSILRIFPEADADRLWHAVARGQGAARLCTNAPPGHHRAHEHFGVVTQADVVTARVETRKTDAPHRATVPSHRPKGGFAKITEWDEAQKKSPAPASGRSSVLIGSVIVGLVGLAIAIYLMSRR